jgi:hypothetical protein
MSLELELMFFVVTLGAVIATSWHVGACGLAIAYLISLGYVHFWGGLIHTFSWYHGGDTDFTKLGFDQLTWAVFSFGVGCCLLSPIICRYFPPVLGGIAVPNLPAVSVFTGILFYGFLRTLLAGVPSFGGLASCGGELFVAGLCLLAWDGWLQKRYQKIVLTLSVLVVLPFFTIVSAGFLGQGAGAALIVITLLTCLVKPRWLALVFLCGVIYAGVCVFVTYMRDRDEMREDMWDENSTVSQRLDRMTNTFMNFEKIDFSNQDQLDRIEARLNQNDLVGRAVYMLDLGEVSFADGRTFQEALISVVPRILWPSKPVTAGSPDIVSYYTGVPFAPGTSVGVGQVMEGYINFGTKGVITVFVIFGLVLGIVDARAGRKLRAGDTLGFVVWFVPGIAFLQPSGSLVDVGATVAASIVLAQLLKIPFALRAKKAAREANEILAASASRPAEAIGVHHQVTIPKQR